MNIDLYIIYSVIGIYLLRKLQIRLRLSIAKHPSLAGHSKMARRIAKLIPSCNFDEVCFFSVDHAPNDIENKRKTGFYKLAEQFSSKSPITLNKSEEIEGSISDIDFTRSYRVPFQFSAFIKNNLKLGSLVCESKGTQIKDLDDNWSYDLTGSYGVNVFGYEFYKDCMEKGLEQIKDLGPVLGPYHPVIVENVKYLKDISGLDEVSFHMSGTEAVMQAVRLARYHTGKSHLVRFCGAYHGWWDGVQPGVGNQRNNNDIYTLKDMDSDTLKVLKTRNDIACILINPLQAMHPNINPPSDAMLISSGRKAHYDKKLYKKWLHELREVCDERGIVLIMDEIFVGFRLAYRGAQEYFSVKADMVTYGKTLGGGLPVGVVCGKKELMKRFKEEQPAHISFARGTFNSHPLVMATMNEFLKKTNTPEIQASYKEIDKYWDNRVNTLNHKLAEKHLPIKIVNMVSVWTILFAVPSRYNWMYQFYLRAQGLSVSWVGSGRIIMSHDYSDREYGAVMQKIITAAEEMKKDGWWWENKELTNKSIKRQVVRELVASFIRN